MTGPGQVSRTTVIAVPGSGRLADLLGGRRPSELFTGAERRLCADRPDLTGWAGRLAAKRAVAELLAAVSDRPDGHAEPVAPVAIEILPDHAGCPGEPCPRSHPPAVRLAPAAAPLLPAGRRLQVSIAHTRRTAVAVALLTGG